MTDDAELTALLWQNLRRDRTGMLGLAGAAPPNLRPMTALVDGDADRGPLWFFTSADSTLLQGNLVNTPAVFTFASKGHDVFATVHGHLTVSTDRAVIDRLWNPWVAAWYQGGKDDPSLRLLRLDTESAEIWRDGSSFLAGLKVLFRFDPQEDYRDSVARVSLA